MPSKIQSIRVELQKVRNQLSDVLKTTSDLLIRQDLLIDKVKDYEESLKVNQIDQIATENEEKTLKFLIEKLDTSLEELKSKTRVAKSVENRQIVLFILRKRFGISSPKLGKLLDRDHSTVLLSVEKIEDRMKIYPEFNRKINKISEEVDDLLKMSERQFQNNKGIETETIPC
jgi:chromosomal replication initiation ATPase DnaA